VLSGQSPGSPRRRSLDQGSFRRYQGIRLSLAIWQFARKLPFPETRPLNINERTCSKKMVEGSIIINRGYKHNEALYYLGKRLGVTLSYSSQMHPGYPNSIPTFTSDGNQHPSSRDRNSATAGPFDNWPAPARRPGGYCGPDRRARGLPLIGIVAMVVPATGAPVVSLGAGHFWPLGPLGIRSTLVAS
jgi:hypothetical protein